MTYDKLKTLFAEICLDVIERTITKVTGEFAKIYPNAHDPSKDTPEMQGVFNQMITDALSLYVFDNQKFKGTQQEFSDAVIRKIKQYTTEDNSKAVQSMLREIDNRPLDVQHTCYVALFIALSYSKVSV